MAIAEIARQRSGMDDELYTLGMAGRGRHDDFDAELVWPVGLAA